MVPEVFSGVNIGKVDFDGRNADGSDSIPQRDTGVGETAWIEYDSANTIAARLLNAIDKCPLMVGLEEIGLKAKFGSKSADTPIDVVQGLATINFRLAGAKEVQIGAVQDQDFHGRPFKRVRLSRWEHHA